MQLRRGFGWCAACGIALACGGSNGGAGSGEGSASADDGVATSTDGGGTSSGGAEGSVGPESSSADDANDDFNDTGPAIFDVGIIPDTPEATCGGKGGKGGGGGGGGGVDLQYIWISNTAQDTLSKINTDTMEEEGRYYAKDSNGDPSRTSVNLNGDVAVANRNGGVAKFWANPDDCNGNNTSTGTGDIKPWGQDDCMAWNHPMVCSSQRPVAWTRGTWSEATCSYEDAKLWTVCDNNVLLYNGDTGETEQTIAIAGAAFVYGGAADADGNFWGLNTSQQAIFRVDHEDYSMLTFPLPAGANVGYGITVDKQGRPWVCQQTVARFNLDTSTWSVSPTPSNGGGCMTDGEDIIWHATNFLGGGASTLVGFDIESLDLVNTIDIPQYVHGISVDFQGKVWGVTFQGSNAYRADPETGQVDTFNQLVGAYTYSDMTGFALSSAGGGGVPQN